MSDRHDIHISLSKYISSALQMSEGLRSTAGTDWIDGLLFVFIYCPVWVFVCVFVYVSCLVCFVFACVHVFPVMSLAGGLAEERGYYRPGSGFQLPDDH